MVSLSHPLALLLLPLLALAIWLRRHRPDPALGIPDGRAALAAAASPGLAWLPEACRLFGVVLVALALAGPGLGPETVLWRGRGVDLMLVVDLSESMAALDFRQGDRSISRLEAVAGEAGRFAAARPGDRIGLVAFGTRAYTVMPPTADHQALDQALKALAVGAAGKRTALGDALALAVKRLRDAPGRAKAVVICSDGRANAGETRPEAAAGLAKALGVTIHAVGVGGDQPAPFLIDHPLLGPEIVHEKADLDEAALSGLAKATGGLYWRAADAAGLAEAIRRIGDMEPSDMVATGNGDRFSLTPLLAGLAVLALAAFAGLSGTRFTRLP
jgi:Ca-activated chloride channel family protein